MENRSQPSRRAVPVEGLQSWTSTPERCKEIAHEGTHRVTTELQSSSNKLGETGTREPTCSPVRAGRVESYRNGSRRLFGTVERAGGSGGSAGTQSRELGRKLGDVESRKSGAFAGSDGTSYLYIREVSVQECPDWVDEVDDGNDDQERETCGLLRIVGQVLVRVEQIDTDVRPCHVHRNAGSEPEPWLRGYSGVEERVRAQDRAGASSRVFGRER